MNFKVYIMPDEGFWEGGRFQFSIAIPANYPHEAPKVHCDTKSYHPNLDLEGNVCLNILREEWKPILSVSAVVHGLQFLFLEPNPEDPPEPEEGEEGESMDAERAYSVLCAAFSTAERTAGTAVDQQPSADPG